MKTKFIILTLIVSLCSCGQEVIDRGEPTIGFSTRTKAIADVKNTRASSIVGEAGVAAAGGFDAWTFKHTGTWNGSNREAVFNDPAGYVHVIYDAGAWNYWTNGGYNAPIYWPAGKMITSFAIAPHGEGTVSFAVPSSPTVTYTVPDAGAAQADLMFATAQKNLTELSNPLAPATIPENFSHALSRISLYGRMHEPDFPNQEEVVITSVAFNSLFKSGGAYLDTPVSWWMNDVPSAYNFEITGAVMTGTLQNLISTTAGELFLLPQVLTGRGDIFPAPAPSDVGMVVQYTVDDIPMTWTGPVPAPAEWEPGKSYRYNITIYGDEIAIVCGQLAPPEDGSWGEY